MTLKRQRPPPLEPCSRGAACGARGRGGAWPLTRSTTEAQPGGTTDRAASAPRTSPASLRAVQRPVPGPRARQALPPAAATHSGRARGRSTSARCNRPPCTSPVPGPPLLRDARPGEPAEGWCQSQSHPETWTKLESQGVRPAAEPAPAQRSGCFVNAPPHLRPTPGSQTTSLPAFQRVINCISSVEKPGQGVPGIQLSPLRDGGARCPRRVGGLRPKAACRTTRPSRKGEKPVAPKAHSSSSRRQCQTAGTAAHTSFPPGGRAQPAPATRPPPSSRSCLGPGTEHRPRPKKEPKIGRARQTLGPGKEATGSRRARK